MGNARPHTVSSDVPTRVQQLGVIGIDSSHLAEFSRRINRLHRAGKARVQVTQCWTDGAHNMPADQVEQWRKQAEADGVIPADGLEQMLDAIDGVMVLSVSGYKHLREAMPALERGLPTYIDKPLTCDLASARKLLDTARANHARCYSASSLRFADETHQIDRKSLGDLVCIDAYGPGELSDALPGLFFYGVHTIEMIDAIWGPGVQRVSAVHHGDRDLVDLAYHDGRVAHLRLERRGAYEFGATVHGTDAVCSFQVNFANIYDRLIDGMIRFFEGGEAPTQLEAIVENIAVMEAGNASMEQGGRWVEVDTDN